MKGMRKWVSVLLFSLLLTGCSKKQQENEYKADTSPGKIEQVALDELCKMAEEKQTFVALLTLSTCQDCANFKAAADNYLKDHNVVLYEVVLDYEEATRDENLDKIEVFITDFSTVPGIFFIENGIEAAHLTAKDDNITEEMFADWVKEYQIDKKETEK